MAPGKPELASDNARQRPKITLDLNAALRSMIRAWLVARDAALFTFVAGTASDPIELYDIEQLKAPVERMNSIREAIRDFAVSIAGRGETVESVIAREVTALLREERPKFLLATDNLPGSF